MLSHDFDLDAILDAQSSDDDGADLPDLGRSIDEILNDAELGEDASFSLLLQKDQAKPDSQVSNEHPGKDADIQRATASKAVGDEGLQVDNSAEGKSTAKGLSSSKVSEAEQSVSGDRSGGFQVRVGEHEQEGRSNDRLPPLKVSASMKNSKIWEFNSKPSPFGAPSPFYARSPGISPMFAGSRPSPRPGAALAAATAASRQLDSPHLITRPPQSPSATHVNTHETISEHLHVSAATDTHVSKQKNEESKRKEELSSVEFTFSDANVAATDIAQISEARFTSDSTRMASGRKASLDFSSPQNDVTAKGAALTQNELSGVSTVKTFSAAAHTVQDDALQQEISQEDISCTEITSLDRQYTSAHEEKVCLEAGMQSGTPSNGTTSKSTPQSDQVAERVNLEDDECIMRQSETSASNNHPNDQDSHLWHNLEDTEFGSVYDMRRRHSDEEANTFGVFVDSSVKADELDLQARKNESEVKGIDEGQEENIQDFVAFHLAEELEKNSANSGLHWKEGAVALPMRLEGIERGPPAIGLLQIDHGGPLSFALASATMRREHGMPQSLAIHANFIGVGMSKGTVLVTPSKYSATRATDETDTKAFFLGNVMDKSNTAVTSICFNPQGDMLLAGYANGALTLWDVARATIAKAVTGEHTAVVVHTVFLEHDLSTTRHLRAISADCKGLVLLHTFTVVPLLRRYSVTTQCLLDGQRTGVVLSLSPLLYDESSYAFGSPSSLHSGGTSLTPTGLSSVMGGMVGGVVSGVNNDVGRKFLYDGASSNESGGVVVLVTHQIALVIRLTPGLEICAKLSRPDGIPEGSIPYTAWRRNHRQTGFSTINSGTGSSIGNLNAGSEISKNVVAAIHDPHDSGVIGNLKDGEDNDKLPLLAFAWDKKVLITQLVRNELKILVQWDIPTKAAGIAWLGEQILVVLTSNEELHLYTKEGSELEQANLFMEEIDVETVVYHTHFLNSFGNPEKVYHNAVAVRGAALYLLGTQKLWRARLLPWKDRIKALQDAGDWMGAFHIAMELYDGKAKGVTGLPKRLDALREAIAPTLLELLSSYIDEAFAYLSLALGSPLSSGATSLDETGNLNGQRTLSFVAEPKALNMEVDVNLVAKEQYARVGGVAIEFCVHIKRTDVLFANVFEKFSAVGQKGAFLELLEPYILKDMLGQLAPEVMQALVEHYSGRGWLQRVEQCVLHMDIASLDFNQVVKLCREHGLYSALIYLFQQGLDDYKSPLEELLVVAQDVQRPNAQAFGYKSLVYLKYCFLGSAFPPGEGVLPSERLPLLRTELLELILSPDGKAVVGSHNSQGSAYPILCYLLKLDTPATLHVLELAFSKHSDFDINVEGGGTGSGVKRFLQKDAYDSEGINSSGISLIQLMIDALVHILTICSCTPNISDQHKQDGPLVVSEKQWPSVSDTGNLYEFLARFVSSHDAVVPKTTLSQILRYLAFGVDDEAQQDFSRKSNSSRRREKLMIKLLRTVPDTEWDDERILRHAYEVEFWQVVALLSARRGNYEAALESLIKDIEQPQHLFEFIQEMLSPKVGLTDTALNTFKETVFARIPDLVSLSSEATLFVVLQHFHMGTDRVIKTLESHPRLLFQYLKAVMNFRSGICEDGACLSLKMGSVSSDTQSSAGSLASRNDRGSMILDKQPSLTELLQHSGMEITDETAELYIQLMCQFEPRSVLKFLQSYENYRLERCLKLCQDYGITDAAIFLFERVGDIGSALDLLLSDLVVHISEMDWAIVSQSRHTPHSLANKTRQLQDIPEVSAVYEVMETAVALCQRNNLRLDQQESESLWFCLLDRFTEPLQDLLSQRDKSHHGTRGFGLSVSEKKLKYTWKVLKANVGMDDLRMVLVHLVSSIVNGIIGHVPLRVIMGKILANHGGHEFQDFKGTILDMLSSYGYELAILGTAKRLIESDTFQSILALKRSRTHAYAPSSSACCICGCNFTSEDMSSQNSVLEQKVKSDMIKPKSPTEAVQNGSSSPIQIFFCGHSAHSICLKRAVDNNHSKKGKSKGAVHCPICPHNIKDALLLQNEDPRTDLLQKSSPVQLRGKSSTYFHFESNNDADTNSGPSRFELLKSLQKGKGIREKSSWMKMSLPTTSQVKHNTIAERNKSGS
ncbi:hypothetical protein O6H91_01G011900 [Diphasiastrum complanatum]|uniref:Uncharacterized protein n=2 Tax=Diphasiastrum complanatum TaxID=34168 RepID=A0ACC2EN47_DIPCM|nr:hypothetical protein O6H91_01G011900 [Diphasiastrum complanatum]KAJ7567918.1 hypothetical protein O6H91_01G011900 [Diphasiastrum complanatum]